MAKIWVAHSSRPPSAHAEPLNLTASTQPAPCKTPDLIPSADTRARFPRGTAVALGFLQAAPAGGEKASYLSWTGGFS